LRGRIRVRTSGQLAASKYDIVQQASRVLEDKDIEVVLEKLQTLEEADIQIDVVHVGDISEKEMKPFFESLFADMQEMSGTSVKLSDNNKNFQLPQELEECLDWFIQE
jgi:hypothetical protein